MDITSQAGNVQARRKQLQISSRCKGKIKHGYHFADWQCTGKTQLALRSTMVLRWSRCCRDHTRCSFSPSPKMPRAPIWKNGDSSLAATAKWCHELSALFSTYRCCVAINFSRACLCRMCNSGQGQCHRFSPQQCCLVTCGRRIFQSFTYISAVAVPSRAEASAALRLANRATSTCCIHPATVFCIICRRRRSPILVDCLRLVILSQPSTHLSACQRSANWLHRSTCRGRTVTNKSRK